VSERRRSFVTLLAASTLVVACGGDDVAPTTPGASSDATSEATAMDAATHDQTSPEMSAPDDASESLLIWVDENGVAPLQAVATAFTEATGVAVVVEQVDTEVIRDRVERSGRVGEGPDIFAGRHEWSGELAARGVIAPVDISAKRDRFVPVSLDAFNVDGRVYAVPYATEAVAMYRNTNLVADAPDTWDDVVEACAVAAVENCVVLAGGGDESDAYYSYPFLSAFGGSVFGYDDSTGFDASTVGLDTPEAISGIEFLARQVTDGVIPATDYGAAKERFLGGAAAFWITGPWELVGLRDRTELDVEVSVIPRIGDGPAQPLVGVQGFYASASSPHLALAQTFLLDFVSTGDVMRELIVDELRTTAWDGPARDDVDSSTQAFAASAADGVPVPNIPEMGAVWEPLGDDIRLVRNGELTATEAMSMAAQAVRTAIAG
jgi:maltose-binding protein MalE